MPMCGAEWPSKGALTIRMGWGTSYCIYSRGHNGIAFLLLRPLYQALPAKSTPPVFKGRLPHFLPDLQLRAP